MPKIALVDDHQMFREGLASIIEQQSDYDVVLECENGQELLDRLTNQVDIVLMDLDMPKLNGLQCMEFLQQGFPDIRVVIISHSKDPLLICELMEFGARGFLHKTHDKKVLFSAIDSVYDTGYFFNDLVSDAMLKKLAKTKNIAPYYQQQGKLTSREKEIVELICRAKTTNEIANDLFLSPKTVNNHRARILEKTGTSNTAGLVVYAIKNKLVNV